MHRLLLALAPLALIGLGVLPGLLEPAAPAAPAGASAPADAALITAIDLSDSIMRHHEWLQFEGIARAVQDPAFLATVAQGRRGRISFAVFTWSSGDQQRLIVPWTLIDGPDSALVVATLLRQAPHPQRVGGGDDDTRSEPPPRAERRTDLSKAIELSRALFTTLPRPSERRILNLISNGVDNVQGGVAAARDAAVRTGITINGVALGRNPALAGYFKRRVIGGVGAFVMQVVEPDAFAEVMRAKFLRDLIASPGKTSARPAAMAGERAAEAALRSC